MAKNAAKTVSFITNDKLPDAVQMVKNSIDSYYNILEGMNVTHDVTERLSWWLFAPVSKKRPNYNLGQAAMKNTCLKSH